MNSHEKNKNVSRRRLFRWGLGLAGTTFTMRLARAQEAGIDCGLTPQQTEGPFYPVTERDDEDHDLTRIQGNTQQASGEIILVEGIVYDAEDCQPIPNALVEIWQANTYGRYDHPGDRSNPAPFDPHFQYWGRSYSDADGYYWFKTILPGAYPANSTWMRPPHIHYKAQRRGFYELTTQLYFAGEEYNDGDLILQNLPASEQEKVVRPFEASDPENRGYPLVRFDLGLRPVR